MKLLVILTVVACSNAAKLDRTYLPPSHAQSSGGSNFLQAPLSGPSQQNFGARAPTNGFNNKPFERLENLDEDNTPNYAANNFGANNGFAQSQAYSGNNAYESQPERPQAVFERNAGILRQDSQNDGKTYSYAYETENGIAAEEHGVATNGVEAQGGYSYTGDDGQVYSVRYTAGQNGFVPQGDHLPTPPPIPAEIQAALEQNARDEANGIFDDGSYNEGKYGNSGDNEHYTGNVQTENFNGNGIYNNGNIQQGNGNIHHGNENGIENIQQGPEANQQDDEDTIVTNNALFRSQPSENFGVRSQDYRAPQNSGQSFQTQATAKAYLPPVANQRGPERNTFGRQQSFNPRTGYQY